LFFYLIIRQEKMAESLLATVQEPIHSAYPT
jgi:hypothetical protein